MASNDRPFHTIESAQEFLWLLAEAINEALQEAREERAACHAGSLERRGEAWELVLYSLTKLSAHMTSGRRLLNDLRTLRNLLHRTTPVGPTECVEVAGCASADGLESLVREGAGG
jgi:hypothetical protein